MKRISPLLGEGHELIRSGLQVPAWLLEFIYKLGAVQPDLLLGACLLKYQSGTLMAQIHGTIKKDDGFTVQQIDLTACEATSKAYVKALGLEDYTQSFISIAAGDFMVMKLRIDGKGWASKLDLAELTATNMTALIDIHATVDSLSFSCYPAMLPGKDPTLAAELPEPLYTNYVISFPTQD